MPVGCLRLFVVGIWMFDSSHPLVLIHEGTRLSLTRRETVGGNIGEQFAFELYFRRILSS
jgi:hypothetical protein